MNLQFLQFSSGELKETVDSYVSRRWCHVIMSLVLKVG